MKKYIYIFVLKYMLNKFEILNLIIAHKMI